MHPGTREAINFVGQLERLATRISSKKFPVKTWTTSHWVTLEVHAQVQFVMVERFRIRTNSAQANQERLYK